MKFYKKVLKNGMRVITVPMKDTKTVTVMVIVEAGSEYETKKINGLSHFLEHMCFKGTLRRPTPKAIATEFDGIGAESNASTGNEFTNYYAKAESKHLPRLLDLISDLYLNPTLPKDELEKEKGVVIEEINMYEDMPHYKVEEVLDELLYGDQPAGFSIAGPKKNIAKLTQDELLAYRKKHYVANGTVLVIAGKFEQKNIYKDIEKAFKGISIGPKQGKTRTKIRQEKPVASLFYKEIDQAHLRLAFRAYDVYDERYWAATMLAAILGAGMSSRLFQKMRDELGLCYYISAQNRTNIDHGNFVVSIGASKDKTALAIKAILAELSKMTEELVKPEELKKAKEFITGHLFLALEGSDDFANYYGFQELYHEKILRAEEWEKKMREVTAHDIRKIARDIFKENKMNLAVVGPFKDKQRFLPLLSFHS